MQGRISRRDLEQAPPAKTGAAMLPPPTPLPSAPRRTVSRRALDAAPPPESEIGWGPTGIRVASGLVPGGPLGFLAGGAGEYAAQRAEGRDDTNWWQVGAQAGLGLIPFKSVAKGGYQALRTMLRGSGTGALMSTGAEVADQIHDRDLDVGRLGTSAAMGAGLGAVGGGVVHGLTRARTPAAAAAEVVFNDQTQPPRAIRPSTAPVPAQPPRAATAPTEYAPRRPYPPTEGVGEPTGTVVFNDQTITPRVITNGTTPPVPVQRRVSRASLDAAPPPPSSPPVNGVPASRTFLADEIGSPEHAEAVMLRRRTARGQIQFPRGTDPATMLGRSVPDDPLPVPSAKLGSPAEGVGVSSPVSRPPDTLAIDPMARAWVGRGAHGNVQVTFPDQAHRDLYAAWGRSKRAITDAGTRGVGFGTEPIDPRMDALARHFGVDPSDIGRIASEYRQQITNAVKRGALGEATEYSAPRWDAQATEGAVAPRTAASPVRDFLEQFDAPITEAERAAARAGTPPPARLSPAAQRRARRAKLAEAIKTGSAKPRYSAEQVVEQRAKAGYDTLAPDDVPSIDQAAARFPSLPEGDLRSMLERFAFKRQQIDSDGLGFDDFIKRERKSPMLNVDDAGARDGLRPLMRRAGDPPPKPPSLDERYRTLTDPNSERGAIDQDLLYTMGSTVAGAGIGSGVGAAFDDDPGRGAAGGAVLGAIAGAGARHPGLLERLQYFNFLGNPMSLAKGAAGSIGGSLVDGLERGDLGRVAREWIKPETARAAHRGFTEGGVAGRSRPEGIDPGSVADPLTWPSRVFGSTDEAGTDVLQRSGRTLEESQQALLTNRPRSKVAAEFGDWRGKHAAARLATPFYRTIANMIERGAERTPGVGYLPAVRGWTDSGADLGHVTRKQAVGALAALAGYQLGEMESDLPEDAWVRRAAARIAPVAAGPAGLLALTGAAVGRKMGDADTDLSSGAARAAALATAGREVGQSIPAPDPMDLTSLRRLLTRLTPSGGRDLSRAMGTDPASLDTKDSLTGLAVSRLPWLNERILDPKPTPGGRRGGTTRRASSRRPSRESR